ncbi:MAG: hypothetical protein PHT33_03795, partial [bacterium]|nr:hypothetical protein [bacterium]
MRSLIRKEWREQRAIVLTLLLMAIAFRLLLVGIYRFGATANVAGSIDNVINIAGWFSPVVFALLLGAIPFAGELAEDTRLFLLSRPIGAVRLFTIKYLFGLALLAILTLAIGIIFHRSGGGTPFLFKSESSIISLGYPLLLIVIYTGTLLATLIFKSPLISAVLMPLMLFAGCLMLLPLPVLLLISLSGASQALIYRLPLILLSALLAVLIILAVAVWRGIVRGAGMARVLSRASAAIIIPIYAAYGISGLLSDRVLDKAVLRARQAGLEFTVKEVAPPPVPDKENAMFAYRKAFDLSKRLKARHEEAWGYAESLYKKTPYVLDMNPNAFSGLDRRQREDIVRMITDDLCADNLFQTIRKAVDMPQCRFDLDYELGFAMQSPPANELADLAMLQGIYTCILADKGSYAEAMQSAITGLRLENSLDNCPLSYFLVSRFTARSVYPLRDALKLSGGRVSYEDYRRLACVIDDKQEDYISSVKYGFACAGDEMSQATGSLSERARWLNRSGYFFENKLLGYYLVFIGKPLMLYDRAFYTDVTREFIRLARLPYYQAKEPARHLDKALLSTSYFLTAILDGNNHDV